MSSRSSPPPSSQHRCRRPQQQFPSPCCLPSLCFILRSWRTSCVFLPGWCGCRCCCKTDKQVDLWSQLQQPAQGNKWNFSAGEDAGDGLLHRVPPDAGSFPGKLDFLHRWKTKCNLELSPNSKVPNQEKLRFDRNTGSPLLRVLAWTKSRVISFPRTLNCV